MKYVSRGLLTFLIVSTLLLLSDLQNRITSKKNEEKLISQNHFAVPGKKYKLGICYFAPDHSIDDLFKGIWKRLDELGFNKGKNLSVIANHANGEISEITQILYNLDSQPLDLILTVSTPCLTAALSTVKNHRVVFTFIYDPLAAGAGKSYKDHVSGFTGVGSFPPLEKTFLFISDVFPGVKRIGTIYNASEANSRKVISVARQITASLGYELIETTVNNTSEVFQATQSIVNKNIDVLFITGDNTVRQAFEAVVKVCDKHSIPVVANHLIDVARGAFAAVGSGWEGVGYRTGNLMGLLLNGVSPDTIPIEEYSSDTIIINWGKAKLLKVNVPQKYLRVASELPKAKKFKAAIVHFVESPFSEDCEKGIRQVFNDKRMEEGQDFTFSVYNAQGDMTLLNNISGVIGSEAFDLIFAISTPTIEMLEKKYPSAKMVFIMSDPIKAGLGKSFSHHLSNLTGISTMSDFDSMIKLIRYIHPGIHLVGSLFTPSESNSVDYKIYMEDAIRKNRMKLITAPANTSTEVMDGAQSLVSRKIEAFCQLNDNLTCSSFSAIMKVSRKSKIPYYGFEKSQLENGAVAVCSRNFFQAGYDAGQMGIEILSGKSPKSIPFQYVCKTDFLISRKNARIYNIHIPDKISADFPQLKITD